MSICHLEEKGSPSLYMLDDEKETIHQTVVTAANRYRFVRHCSSSFVPSTFINHINEAFALGIEGNENHDYDCEIKDSVYNGQLHSTNGKCNINVKVNK